MDPVIGAAIIGAIATVVGAYVGRKTGVQKGRLEGLEDYGFGAPGEDSTSELASTVAELEKTVGELQNQINVLRQSGEEQS